LPKWPAPGIGSLLNLETLTFSVLETSCLDTVNEDVLSLNS
jgi:hypothetical protein